MIGGRTKFLFLSMMMALSTNVAVHARSISQPNIQQPTSPKIAAACLMRLGYASGGQLLHLNVCSIKQGQGYYRYFTYNFGPEPVSSLADCRSLSWITYPENQRHYPKSAATDLMIRTVCR